ncbi:hypothetical protein LMG9449_1552 [Lactococcus lactis subsp. lactis]|uniref:Uncharacterized protein n=1 Tax=Lactococcus lactis subsp. lactis TaxID=1360 RepID=A0A0V8DW47_LACLL|nr:hypothetical protein LMG9449_1552 [Lactococcus lactis subsp. lactis]
MLVKFAILLDFHFYLFIILVKNIFSIFSKKVRPIVYKNSNFLYN